MTPTPPTPPMAAIMRLPPNHHLLPIPLPPTNKPRQNRRKKEHHTIHNPQRPARLQQRTRLIDTNPEPTEGDTAQDAKARAVADVG